MSNLDLWCWILGHKPPSGRIFQVQISLEATVAGLKEAIQEKNRVAFDRTDARILDLYKVNVPMDDLDKLNDIDPNALECWNILAEWERLLDAKE
jgi:Crinkler effector protein N-terminal domain